MSTNHAWWSHLRHGGVLVAPALLPEFFPEPPGGEDAAYGALRDAWLRFTAGPATPESRRSFVDAVLEGYLGLQGWQKGPQVESRFKAKAVTGEPLRPDRVLVEGGAALLSVRVDDSDRVGIGRGRRSHARMVDLLRRTGARLGLLTNGRQFRCIHAGPDYDAWAEWDAEAWFDEGEARSQLFGLRALLGRDSLTVPDAPPLLSAIEASRTRQGELAQVLGEQVRLAVELLIGALDLELRRDEALLRSVRKDPRTGGVLDETAVLRALYQAATRIVMRLVVLLFAEARDLLPRSLEPYHDSYGVEGLFHTLHGAASHEGTAALAEHRSAWPRLLALFDLIYGGSAHELLPVRAYGGTLFRPGDADDADPVVRALAAFEEVAPDDAVVYQVLRLLKVGRLKVRRGRQTAWVSGPVDFSDLRTEYIGIIYEGLLDYELKRAGDDPLVFLNLGKQPALPLSRLESLSEGEISDLVEKLKKERTGPAASEDEEADGSEEAPETEGEEDAQELAEDAVPEPSPSGPDEDEGLISPDEWARQRALAWAERAVEAARLVRRPRGKRPDLAGFRRQVGEVAQRLVARVVAPGQLYLIAWGGTRKGSGTFYTRPAHAVPPTHRPLGPPCDVERDGELSPRPPEEILALKVCDPAMGSGSFLVAALRYLTEALAASLVVRRRISARNGGSVVTLPLGLPATGELHEEIPDVPPDDERFEARLRARLARHVVERCIYGVDVNPMAVELARLSLWVETMDPQLPFEFLDHKLKVGDSLVGCWLHLMEDYPARAWDREAGDGKTGQLTKWLREVKKSRVKPEIVDWLRSAGGQDKLGAEAGQDAIDALAELRRAYDAIHALPSGSREEAYRAFLGSETYRMLKLAMDRWSAIWFWPPGREPALTPGAWLSPSAAVDEIVDEVARERRFFHWGIEFPDAFRPGRAGFDAVLGNPPWEVAKPNSQEFFSNHDPLYRTYGKQEALAVQRRLFEADPPILRDWVAYQGGFKAMSNWVGSSEDPFDVTLGRGREGAELKGWWEGRRRGRKTLSDPAHPFRHQGSADLNTYKMFLEAAHHLLAEGGRLGFLVPSGIWTDKGATEIRRLFLHRCRWEWCYGFENRQEIFPIHRSFKFAPVVVERGGRTERVMGAFMRHDVGEWERPDPPALPLAVDDIERFAPKTLSFMEFKERRDLEIAERIYADHPLLGDEVERLGGRYSREFDMTNDSKLFTRRRELEAKGLLKPGEDSRDPRVRARLRVAGYLPLYEGKAFWQHNPYYAQQKYFVAEEVAEREVENSSWRKVRCVFRDVARSTDQRTFIASFMPPAVHGNKAPSFDSLDEGTTKHLLSLLDSLTLDFVVRMKVSATLNWFYVETLPIPDWNGNGLSPVARHLVVRLNCVGADFPEPTDEPLVDPAERLAARLVLDALVAGLYRLRPDDLAHIATRFPIYDKGVPDEHRYPTLAVEVFRAYHADGLEAAQAAARRVAEARRAAGLGFGLDEIWVPEGGWARANEEARAILGDA